MHSCRTRQRASLLPSLPDHERICCWACCLGVAAKQVLLSRPQGGACRTASTTRLLALQQGRAGPWLAQGFSSCSALVSSMASSSVSWK